MVGPTRTVLHGPGRQVCRPPYHLPIPVATPSRPAPRWRATAVPESPRREMQGGGCPKTARNRALTGRAEAAEPPWSGAAASRPQRPRGPATPAEPSLAGPPCTRSPPAPWPHRDVAAVGTDWSRASRDSDQSRPRPGPGHFTARDSAARICPDTKRFIQACLELIGVSVCWRARPGPPEPGATQAPSIRGIDSDKLCPTRSARLGKLCPTRISSV